MKVLYLNLTRQFLLIFVAAFVFTMVQWILQLALARDMEVTALYTIGSLVVSIVLVFVVFYFIGKRIDLKLELGSAIVALALGNFVGYLSGSIPSNIILGAGLTVESVPDLILTSLLVAFTGNFFVELAAMCVAYIRRNKPEQTANQSQDSDPNPTPES